MIETTSNDNFHDLHNFHWFRWPAPSLSSFPISYYPQTATHLSTSQCCYDVSLSTLSSLEQCTTTRIRYAVCLVRVFYLPYQRLQPLTRWKSLPSGGLGFTTHGVTGGQRHRFDTACRVGLTFPRVETSSKLALPSPLRLATTSVNVGVTCSNSLKHYT